MRWEKGWITMKDAVTVKGTVLVVDDDEPFRYTTVEILKRKGFAAEAASTADEATVKLQNEHFDVVIADIVMPGNEELEFARELAELAPGVPVILVTGHPTLQTALDSLKLPVAAYLVKPFDFEKLERAVEQACEQNRAFRIVEEQSLRLEAWTEQLRAIRQQMATSRAAYNAVPLDQFMDITLKNITFSIEGMRGLVQALNQRVTPDVSVCKLLGCPRLDSLTGEIENTIAVLEKTKHSFKSKELAALRRRLEGVLEDPNITK